MAAATREVNARVVADARRRGVWACDAADPDAGDFVTPAVVDRGPVRVAVATGVPALTRRLKRKIEADIGGEYGAWAALLAELRPAILAGVPPERRAALWEALTAGEWAERIRRGEGAGAEMAELVRRACGGR